MTDELVQSLGGMSPKQAQTAAQMLGSALMQKQKQEATARYRQQQLSQQSRKLDIYEDREERLRQSAKAEQEMEIRKFNNDKKLNAIKMTLKGKQIQRESAKYKLLTEKANKLKDEQDTLDALGMKVKLPGTEGEEISVGTAVKTGIYDDIIKDTTERASQGEFANWEGLGSRLKSYLYLTKKDDVSEKEARGMVWGRDVKFSDLVRLLTTVQFNKVDEANKIIRKWNISKDEPYNLGQETRTNLPSIELNLDTSKNPLE